MSPKPADAPLFTVLRLSTAMRKELANVAEFTDQQLSHYLDEALPSDLMAAVENALRSDRPLRERLIAIAERREAGVHTLGDIWRRNRLSCPTREELGSFILDTLDDDVSDYVRFHLETIGCRICEANLADLRQQQATNEEASQTRRQRFFQTSAGLLKRHR
ncbi:MAG: hypothetical protein KatS3mg111_4061 [Pirellulaceae bacterium]|nr:MAG: hypothetical protein KatS3mg111_4061 [Pirellulaceae bacterium]